MNKVITINLAGRSYKIEEPGYNILKAYLEKAENNLANNPDKEEILKDFNLAIAEKCETYLSASKDVITASEVEKIIAEMGPVESSESEGEKTEKKDGEHGNQKKIYILPDNAYILGVCNAIAVYFDIDVTLVRIAFVVLAVLTRGAWIFVYFVMYWVIPKANTPEEKAEAWNTMRMTAQTIIDKTRSGYEGWDKWQKRYAKKEQKRWQRQQYRHHYNGYGRSGFMEFLYSLLGLVWFVLFVAISWYGYNHVPIAHSFFDMLGHIAERGIEWLNKKLG
ncbi:MAG TPA: PspC domain-containing protein [Candidatus Paceibacterota bacterium]|jgi:phage shock protein PspC (stress-responsive transcriptional regulator)|nr:PspC domain-containing protein [Candidatus Paceibacterota bacterium]